jgi:hypothetical protein
MRSAVSGKLGTYKSRSPRDGMATELKQVATPPPAGFVGDV